MLKQAFKNGFVNRSLKTNNQYCESVCLEKCQTPVVGRSECVCGCQTLTACVLTLIRQGSSEEEEEGEEEGSGGDDNEVEEQSNGNSHQRPPHTATLPIRTLPSRPVTPSRPPHHASVGQQSQT